MATTPTATGDKKREFARGWKVLTASTIGVGTGVISLTYYSLGSFVAPLQEEFGWSRTQITTALLYLTIPMAIAGPGIGWLLDRFGPKLLALTGIPVLAATFLWLSQLSGGIGQFYMIFVIMAVFAGSTSPLSYSRAVNGEFNKARGLALGITLAGMGVAALVLPPVLSPIIASFGWRPGFLTLALIALIPFPLVLLGLRGSKAVAATQVALVGATRQEAVRTRVFWHLTISFILVGVSAGAVIPHLVPLLTDAGVSKGQAAATASLIGIGVLVGRVAVGWLVDRFFAPYVATPLFLTTAAGCLILLWGGPALAPVAALLIGLTMGAEADLVAYFCARYFGLRSYGFIYGIVYSIFAIAIAVGPIILAYFYGQNGNYNTGLAILAGTLIVGALSILALPRFDRYIWSDHDAEPNTAADSSLPAAELLR